jgi:hypothetical protein
MRKRHFAEPFLHQPAAYDVLVPSLSPPGYLTISGLHPIICPRDKPVHSMNDRAKDEQLWTSTTSEWK